MSLPPLVEPAESLTVDEVRRYSRHLIIPDVAMAGQKRLKNAKVLCVGAGGLGSPALMYLAAAGVGTLGIVEFDVVDESNLQRQIIHGQSDIGRSKAESAADWAFDRPISLCPWMIWRCKFDSSTVSNSTIPRVPTPAAARYISAGEPRPPAPMQRTLAFFSRFCPVMATSGMIRWRL